jgi:rRNA maturation endonuclease Nob1
MPHLKCKNCQHEWDSNPESKCDWCGAEGVILEEETSFEKFVKEVLKEPKKFFSRIGLKKQ